MGSNSWSRNNVDPDPWKVWEDETAHDTTRLVAIRGLIWDEYVFAEGDSAEILNQLQLDFAIEKDQPKFIASAYNTRGIRFYLNGVLDSAYIYLEKALKLNEDLGNKDEAASNRTNLASVLMDMGLYEEAVKYNFESLTVFEESGNLFAQSQALNNIGYAYDQMAFYDLAITYYLRSADLVKASGNYEELMTSYINLGVACAASDRFDDAVAYYNKALKLSEEYKNEPNKAAALAGLGKCELMLGNINASLDYHEQSLALYRRTILNHHIATELSEIGEIYRRKKEYETALNYSLEAMEFAFESEQLELMRKTSEYLYFIYNDMNNYEKALTYFTVAVGFQDSIRNMENMNAVLEQNYEHEYEKKALVDSIAFENKTRFQKAEIAEQKAQLQKEQTQRYALWGGLGALAILALVFLRSYRIKKADNLVIQEQKIEVEKQRDKIDEQHHELHESHKEITDSINYAKHLQDAILPALGEISAALTDSFVLFNPKDVVSGDFYWFERNNKNEVLIAAADCTGHGVPGSMVSVVCSSALNRSVKEFGLNRPAEILDKTRELVVETFAKSGSSVRDGMDIALCLIRQNSVVFCGANNPLWIVRASSKITDEQLAARATLVKGDLTLIEIAANRQPVGKDDLQKAFIEHEVQLFPGDSLYMFSDGFPDQFGEKTGKKFKKKPFKELIIRMNDQPMKVQEELLLQAFNVWKGDLEQIDDVCVIGARL
jgi:serine phosphatase RsbU (regulator of sigma subunit)